jgi:hypothetical protein
LQKEPILFKLNSALYKYEQAGETSSAFFFLRPSKTRFGFVE